MPLLVDLPELVGFFSYSREDDEDSYGAISALRERIQRELRGQLGRSMTTFRLWQDKGAIAAGQVWESEIKAAVAHSVFFIPIITPTVVHSQYCRFELESFLAREAALGREDLIFPVLYIKVPELEASARQQNDPVLSIIARRQYMDWREFRLRDLNSIEVKAAVELFCTNICDALRRPSVTPQEREAREQAVALQRAEDERKRNEAEASRLEEEARQRALAQAREGANGESRKLEAEALRQQAKEDRLPTETEVLAVSLLAIGLLVVVGLAAFRLLVKPPTQLFSGFGPSFQYDDSGLNPAVSVSGATVVEVHNGGAGAGPLWYRVGKANASAVAWNDSHQYDNGFNPSVALIGATVVEVHNEGAGAGPLLYRVGQVTGSTVTWNDSHQYDNGNNPSVALAGDTVVEVHNGGAGAGPIWYRMGKLNGGAIAWSHSYEYDYGYNPSVSAQPCLNNNKSSCGVNVFEVHNGGGAFGPMWYRFGNSSDGSTISWQNHVNYDQGWNPKISFSSGAFLLEVHNGSAGAGPMWYRLGAYVGPSQSPPIEFDPGVRYANGNNPSVACDPLAKVAIEVHNGGSGAGPLWYHRGVYQPPLQ